MLGELIFADVRLGFDLVDDELADAVTDGETGPAAALHDSAGGASLSNLPSAITRFVSEAVGRSFPESLASTPDVINSKAQRHNFFGERTSDLAPHVDLSQSKQHV